LGFAGLRIGGALVGQRDQQSLVEECQFAQALRQRVVVVLGGSKDGTVGKEVNLRAAFFGGARFVKFVGRFALGIIRLPSVAIAPDLQLQIFAESVHARNADAVQPAGNLVSG